MGTSYSIRRNPNGYALKNMHVSDGGIFGLMRGATVKNLKLENVYLTNNPPSGVSIQNGGYSSILAFSAPSSTFENITMTIASAPNTWSWKRDGLLVCSSSWGAATFRNITIDACGLTLNTLLGISHSDKNVYENVVIKAANYVAIGYTADSYNNDVQNTAALMSEFPAGVTFKKVTKVFEITNTETSVGLGGSLENVVVFDQDKILSVPRFDDELIRHKILDAVGDLYLLGHIKGHVIAVKTGHAFNSQLAKQIHAYRNKEEK